MSFRTPYPHYNPMFFSSPFLNCVTIVIAGLVTLMALLILYVVKIQPKFGFPPLVSRIIFETYIPPGKTSPFIRYDKYINNDQSEGNSSSTTYLVYYQYKDFENTLNFGTYYFDPKDSETTELIRYEYEWSKWWQRIFYADHHYGNIHFLFPRIWAEELAILETKKIES